jgi:hypothetical protein
MTNPTPARHVAAVVVDERNTTEPLEVRLADDAGVYTLASSTTSTQVANPTRTLGRSIFQLVVAIATTLPQIVPIILGAWDPEWLVTALGQVLVVHGVVTRLMALPGVDTWLQEHLPALASLRVQKRELA